MNLCLPANYDELILPELADLSVTEIYGKLPVDIAGGGRPTYMASPLKKKALSRYILAARKHGISFNYLLNSACLGNEEWSQSFQKKFNKLLEWVVEQGVDTVTISLPSIHRMVKKRFPHLKTKVGIYAQVDSVKRAQYWADEGADAINIESFSINRDFPVLKSIRAAVSSELVLIANHFCQPNCPYQYYHQVGHAHSSGSRQTFLIDWPLIQCQHARLKKPELFIAAGWIRPEDISAYENIGYKTFKLLERNIPSKILLMRARAYHGRRFDGNLADLLLSFGFDEKAPGFSWTHLARSFQVWNAPLRAAKQILDFVKTQGMLMPRRKANSEARPPIFIDSSKIPADFIKFFERGISCANSNCHSCSYCSALAAQAVRIDEEYLGKILPMYEDIDKDINSGALWGL